MKTDVNQASLDTYRSEEFQNAAATYRQQIVSLLKRRGPMTRREISIELLADVSCIAGRVNELIESGDVRQLPGLRACPITKRNVNWVCHPDDYSECNSGEAA